MLRKLEQKGLVALPAARHFDNCQRRIVDVPHDDHQIETDLRTISPARLEPGIRSRSPRRSVQLPYGSLPLLRCKGHVGEHMKYIAYDRNDRSLACLLFGSAA